MAYLLGSKTCIDSLRVDVEDLQTVIYDIVGKTGSLKCHSWKFPDKLATDVEITELLERYQYGKNDVDNQVSHVVLFEIIIDRLLLIIHGSWRFLHEIQTKIFPHTLDSASTINQQTGLSVGLVVKKYWNKLLQLFTILQQHKIRPENNERIVRRQSKTNQTVEKHIQTIETSFSPCSSCIKLQQCFRELCDNIINLCQLYNFPSSLAYYRCSKSTTIPEWLSIDDINNWFDCQAKDFDRLTKHLEYLNTTLNQTKTELDENTKQLKHQYEINENLEKSIQDEKLSKKNLENMYEKKLNETKKEYDEQIKSLIIQKTNLEQQFKETNQDCVNKNEQLIKLESSNNELKVLNGQRIKSDETIKTFEQNCIRLQTELDVIKRDLDERNQELKKERIRIENMIRQEESYQLKQKTLTKSYDDLSQECQLLKKQINELEYQRDQLQKTNGNILQEVTSLRSVIDQLQQQSRQTDLNGHTSNKLVHDMQNQIRTHEHRIDLLQRENDSLKSSLEKLLITNSSPQVTEQRYEELRNQSKQEQSIRPYSSTTETKSKPTPLWLLNNEIIEQQQQAFTDSRPVTTANYIPRFSENDYAANGWIRSDLDVPQQPEQSQTTPDVRPATRAQSTRTIPSVAIHEMLNDNKNRTKVSNRPLSFEHTARRNTPTTRTRRSSTNNLTHRCTTCNRTYDGKRNYDIHKLYCRT